MRKVLFTCVALALGFAVSSHAIVLIDPDTNNGSFEYAGGVLNTTKIIQWDTTPDIDNWSEWVGESTDSADSGVELTGSATDGVMSAFLRGGNATYNMTTYVAQEGDIFDFAWDHTLREDRNHSAWLVWDNAGSIDKILASQVDTTGALTPITYSGSYTVQAGDPWIGSTVGVGIHTFGAYPEIDNVTLDVIPEPSTLALFGLFGGLVALRRRSVK